MMKLLNYSGLRNRRKCVKWATQVGDRAKELAKQWEENAWQDGV